MALVTPENRVNFTFYNHDSGIFMDEKKKRYTDFNNMDKTTYFRYKGAFTNVNIISIFFKFL